MKQSKVASAPPPPSPAPQARGPRYRYFSTTPATVTLRMRDLKVPEKARTAGYNSEQFVDLPCADIFGGPAPKILLSRLAEIAPNCVTAKNLPDEGVKVCSARLALAYVVTEGREVLEESSTPEPVAPAEPAAEEFAPPSSSPSAADAPSPTPETIPAPEMTEFLPPVRPVKPSAQLPESVAQAVEPPVVIPAAPATDSKKPSLPSLKSPIPRVVPKPPQPFAPAETPEIPAPPAPLPPAASEVASPVPPPSPDAPAAEPSEAKSPESTALPAAKKPFSLFPMFRRKEASDNKPSVQVPRGRIEIPKPKRPFPPSSVTPEPEAPAEAPGKEFKPSGPKPSIPKPRFEPVRSFEPRVASTPEPQEPQKVDDPSPAPAPEPPKVAEMPELPIFAPKVPPPASEPVQPAEPAQPASEESPAPSKTQPIVAPAPVGEFAPELDTPPEPPKTESRIIPPLPKPPLASAAPAPEPAAPPVAPPAPPAEAPAPALQSAAVEEIPKERPVTIEVPPPAPAVLVETEHVSQKDVPPEIAEQDSLQAIFHTEEQLSVDRVLELCGNLPGIHSCVLSHGSSVIAAHNTPDSVDVVSLSAHALEMLKAMRASSAKMGIGAVPAVTVHSEKGPITFFHQEDLCLLVLHKDRGFVPGVREKLQFVMDELSKAKLPLQLGDRPGKKLIGQ